MTPRVTEIVIGELPPEVGPPGRRLIVKFSNDVFESLLIQPIDKFQFAQALQYLADRVLCV